MNDDEADFARLKQISDQIVGLRSNLEYFPANEFMIVLLEAERDALKKKHIKIVPLKAEN